MKPRLVHTFFATAALAVALSAQTESAPPPQPETAAPETAPAGPPAPAETNSTRQQRMMRRQNFNPAEIQTRMMESLREQMGVKDDAEWNLISERINAVMELRRGQLTGAIGAMFVGLNRGGNGGGGNRGGFQMSPEQDALRAAVTDNLPDAEITARLAKFRDARKQSEAKLEQARENLRAVLTVRQEAIMVMMGMLN